MARQEHETLYRDVNVKVLGPGDDGRTDIQSYIWDVAASEPAETLYPTVASWALLLLLPELPISGIIGTRQVIPISSHGEN